MLIFDVECLCSTYMMYIDYFETVFKLTYYISRGWINNVLYRVLESE